MTNNEAENVNLRKRKKLEKTNVCPCNGATSTPFYSNRTTHTRIWIKAK